MTTTYDWIIEQLEAYPEKEGHTDVVFSIHWRVNANDGGYAATNYGSVAVTLDKTSVFTPYENLTKEQVVSWVKSALGAQQVVDIEAGLAGQIEDLKNPPVIRPGLPWAAE